jgi:hypothetical protein
MDNIINDTLKLINTISTETVNLTKKIVEQYNSTDNTNNNEQAIIIKLLSIIDEKNMIIQQKNNEINNLKEQLNKTQNQSDTDSGTDTETVYDSSSINTPCSLECSCEEECDKTAKYYKWLINKCKDYRFIIKDKELQLSYLYEINRIVSLEYDYYIDGFNKLFENNDILIYVEFLQLEHLLQGHYGILKKELEKL